MRFTDAFCLRSVSAIIVEFIPVACGGDVDRLVLADVAALDVAFVVFAARSRAPVFCCSRCNLREKNKDFKRSRINILSNLKRFRGHP